MQQYHKFNKMYSGLYFVLCRWKSMEISCVYLQGEGVRQNIHGQDLPAGPLLLQLGTIAITEQMSDFIIVTAMTKTTTTTTTMTKPYCEKSLATRYRDGSHHRRYCCANNYNNNNNNDIGTSAASTGVDRRSYTVSSAVAAAGPAATTIVYGL